jgi:zinc transport system ATP-binding protein
MVTEILMQQKPLFRLENISLETGGKAILRSVDMTVMPGEIVTIIGPNGAGKTSLLKVMLGLVPPTQGNVWREKGVVIGYVPQRLQIPATIPLTVAGFAALGSNAGKDAIAAKLQEAGLSVPLTQTVQSLSGGEFQRLLLARALLRQPAVLVLDEPAQGLDIAGEAEFYHLVRAIRTRYGCAVVMVSHDLHLVMSATDQVICLNTHVCCSGKPEAISRDPAYLQLFGKNLVGEFAVYHHHHDHHHAPDGSIIRDDKEHL